ncbi:amyloid beta precursor like protein 2-like [Saccoglossus kowalevskii]
MAQRMCLPLFLIALVYSGSRATYVEAVAGAFDLSKGHPAPRIAQYCGSVSMHIDLVTGDWVADSDRYADCQDKNTEILIM